MKPMGTENPSRPNFPARPAATPFAAAPQTTMPFLSSGSGVGSDTSFRPTPPAVPPTAGPFFSSGPVVGSEASSYRPSPPARSNDRIGPPLPSSYGPPPGGPFQRFPTPQFSSTSQSPAAHAPPVGQPIFSVPIQHPSSKVPTPPISLHTQPNISSMPRGPSPQSVNLAPPSANVPQSPLDSSFPRQTLQQYLPPLESSYPTTRVPPSSFGYPSNQPHEGSQSQPPQFFSHQGSYVPAPTAPYPSFPAHRGGYVPPPPLSTAFDLHSRGQMQHPSSGPPIGAVQGLAEEFSSLSLGSVPGSVDPGIDSKALPRPLDGDVEPDSYAEMYPLNCNSRVLRLATTAMPNSPSLVSRWHLPLGVVVCPLAEAPDGGEVPIVNFGSTGIIRCRRCRTYVNPYVVFTDGGRKWRCNICALPNEVPGDYFAPLDASGRRIDLEQRPELTKGSVEFVAPTEYMVRPPMPPLYFFLIDVSQSAVRSGMVEIVAKTIRSCLDELPGFPRTQIGFMTFDSTIHFYNMKSSLTQPQMMVVSDLDDIFVPLPDDLLVNLSESRSVVETFLDSLPSIFQENVNLESAFGPALKATFMVMSQLGGKLLIFQNTMPSLGVGRLRLRGDDVRAYGTDREHTLRIPEDSFYKQMAADFTKYQIGVNVYAFSDKYADIASLGTLAKYTGGQVYYYPSFQPASHAEKLRHELARDLTRETAWEAVMRIRCGKGVRFTSYHGNFMLRTSDLLALPAVDCDKAFAMQFSLEEALLTNPTVFFQVALLYTSSSGERRIRVHTAAAPVVADLGEMYRLADTGAIVSLLCRLAIEKTLSHKLEDARNFVQTKIVKALREYRNLYVVQHRLGGRMIYPECLKFLPLYGLALCKSAPLRGGNAGAQLDERCAAGYTMMALPVKQLLKLLYPSLIRIDEFLIKGSVQTDKFDRLRLAAESLDSGGVYIYDDGFRFVIWFGRMLPPDIAKNLLGEDFADLSRVSLYEGTSAMSKRLIELLKKFRESDPSYYQLCHLVRQGEQPREGFFLHANLIEDQVAGTTSYADWIMQLHRQVQQNG